MKLVINRCFGGFGLSILGMKRLGELRGKEYYFFDSLISQEKYKPIIPNAINNHKFYFCFDIPDPNILTQSELWDRHVILPSSIPRNDANLIRVVEELGEKANGRHAELEIIEIPDDIIWEVDNYDGMEAVHEVHRKW